MEQHWQRQQRQQREQQQQRQHGARDTRNVLAAISARVDEAVDAYDDDGMAGLRLAYERESKEAVSRLLNAQSKRRKRFDTIRSEAEIQMQYFHEDDWRSEEDTLKDELVSKEYEANLAMDAVASLLASVRD
eukprot:g945.t1